MAATDPVTPSRRLAMGPRGMQVFQGVEQSGSQLTPAHALIGSFHGTKEGVGSGALQRVGHHQIGGRMAARGLSDFQQALVTYSNLQLEFDEQTTETPVRANAVDQLGSAHQAQPEFWLIALDLAGTSIVQQRRPRGWSFPAALLGVKAGPSRRRIHTCRKIIANRRTVDDAIKAARGA